MSRPSSPRRRRFRRLAALLGAAAVALAGCSSSSGSGGGSGGSGGSDNPVKGGNFTFALASDPVCIDPHQVGSNDSIYVARQLVDSLTDQDPDTGKIVPWLAESWEVSPDATQFTFKLRPGVTFSDGTPLNAASVKANLDSVVKDGAKAVLGGPYLSGYVETDVVDDLTARVVFNAPSAQFLQATSTFSLGLLAPSTLALAPADRCTANIVGSGPFTLRSYASNQAIVVAKRTGYAWGSSLFTTKGEANLDTVTFQIVPEAAVRTGSLQSGQIDGIGGVPPSDEPSLAANGFALESKRNPGVVFNLQANISRPVTSDPAVRTALQRAVNGQEIVDTVLSDKYAPATSILASTTPDYEDISGSFAFDLDKAKKILDDAGWKAGSDGIRSKNGQSLTLTVVYSPLYGPSQDALELLQQQVRKAGIGLDLQQVPTADFNARITAGDWDYYWGNLTRADPDILRTLYSSAGSNRGHLPAASDLQTALVAQAGAGDPDQRKRLVDQAQQAIIDNGYTVPVFELTTVLGLSKKVHDVRFEASSRLQLHDTWKSS